MGCKPHDEVDRIIAAWERERPDLDASPMAVLSRVTRLARHLELARKAAFSAHALEAWEFDVLAALRRTGRPYTLTPSKLAAETLVTSGTMTNRLDRLESRALVHRATAPKDGRGVLVSLTPEGIAKVDAALAELLALEESMLDALSPAQRSQLTETLRLVLIPFDSLPLQQEKPKGIL